MPPTIETKHQRIKELRHDLSTCHDPYRLLAEFIYDNERLREQIKRLESGMCTCL